MWSPCMAKTSSFVFHIKTNRKKNGFIPPIISRMGLPCKEKKKIKTFKTLSNLLFHIKTSFVRGHRQSLCFFPMSQTLRLSNDKKYISKFAVIYYDVIIWYLISVNFVPSECPVCSIYAPSAYYNYSCVRISLLDQGFRDSLAPAGGSLSTSFYATKNTVKSHY